MMGRRVEWEKGDKYHETARILGKSSHYQIVQNTTHCKLLPSHILQTIIYILEQVTILKSIYTSHQHASFRSSPGRI